MLIQVGDLSGDFRPWQIRHGRVFATPFALDIETPVIVGHEVPEFVLGAAYDGNRGFFLTPDRVFDFLTAHSSLEIVFHHCAFDLAVLSSLLAAQGHSMDVYDLVDQNRVWDSMLLHKLHGLATVGHTYQGKGQSTLEACASRYLGVDLAKNVCDLSGNDVRTSWGLWKGRPPGEIPPVYLDYLGKDVLCTLACYQHLRASIDDVLADAYDVWGYVDSNWLAEQQAHYGPQTHHLQVKALVALAAIERVGFDLDVAGRDEILTQVQGILDGLREELRQHGYLAGQPGSDKALQAIIRQTLQKHPYVRIPLTPTEKKFSTKEEDLDALAEVSDFFSHFKEFKQVSALVNNHLRKMGVTRIHSHYDVLKNTGRTSASSPNIQSLPKKRKEEDFDIRRCFRPATGKLFYVADYGSIELRTLAQALLTQFGLDSAMAREINRGTDLHRLLAARMKATRLPDGRAILANKAKLAELMASLTKAERDAAKPANFGLPAGMGIPRLKDYARTQYGQPYSDEDAAGWKQSWLASYPEMGFFLEDHHDASLRLAERLQLTPGDYADATGEPISNAYWTRDTPAAWLGGMAYKVLSDSDPMTTNGRPYSDAVQDYFWSHLQALVPDLKPKIGQLIQARQPSLELRLAMRTLLDRAGVFTITGRLRALASYSARRNTVFQGAAADGAKLALYRLWRAGFTVVAFIHDEVVVEVDEAADLASTKQQIDDILIGAMQDICPDLLIEVEGGFRRRWGKDPIDEVPIPTSQNGGNHAAVA